MFYLRLSFLFSFFISAFVFADAPKNIVVLANKNSKESVLLAKDYCRARSISESFILEVSVPDNALISRESYETKIENVLFNFLKEKELISVSGESKNFRENVVTSCKLDYLVICKGIPFRISETKKIDKLKPERHLVDSASVDSEIALLLRGKYEIKGLCPNPAFGLQSQKGSYKNFLLICVARLDGTSFDDARNLYKSAMLAERDGLRGRAYIDLNGKYPEGDKWLENSKELLAKLGFDISIEKTSEEMGYTDRMDACAFYYGWYSSLVVGYFNDENFKLANGACALHIHSFSASKLYSRKSWTATFAAANAATTFGNIDEPFLAPTHRPDTFSAHLINGLDAGEATLYATPSFSWKGVYLGDPLYSPFKISLEKQIENIDANKIDELSQYVIIRKMNLLDKDGDRQAALNFGLKYTERLTQNCALNWKISQYYSEAENELAKKFAHQALQEAKNKFETFGLAFEILKYLNDENLTAQTYEQMIKSAWQGHDNFLKEILKSAIKIPNISESAKKSFIEKNLELNPPPSAKNK